MPIQLFQNFSVCQAANFPVLNLASGELFGDQPGIDPASACDRLNELTTAALKAPLTALKDLRVPLEDALRDAGDNFSTEDKRKLDLIVTLEPFEKKVDVLEKNIQRPDALLLCRALRKELVTAVEKGDMKVLKGWDEKYDKLVTYANAETKMRQVLEWAQNRFPQNGRFNFELDFTSDNGRVGRYLETCRASGPCEELSELEPDIDYYKKLTLVQVYRDLKDSLSEEDRNIADKAEEAISNYRFLTNSLNSFFLGRQYEVTPSWEALDHMTEMIEATYGAQELKTFCQKVAEKENANLKSNEGYQARVEFGKTIAFLKQMDGVIKAQHRPFEEIENNVDQKMLDDLRTQLQERTTSYRDFLESEEKKLQSEANNAAGVPDETYAGTDFAPPPAEATPELDAVREKLDRVKVVMEGLGQRVEGFKADFDALAAVTPEIAEMVDAHAQGLLNRMSSFVSNSASTGGVVAPSSGMTYKEKTAIYASAELDIRKRMVIAMVDGRIEQYEAFQDEKRGKDRVVNVLKAPFELLQGPEPESYYPEPAVPEVSNEQMIAAYREIGEKLDSDDDDTRKEGLADFQNLECIHGHETLYEAYEGNALFNSMIVGVGVVIAAAVTGGLAATAAEPFLVGTWMETWGLKGLVITALEGTVFTVAHTLLDSLVKGENRFSASTLLECGINSLMMGYMKKAMTRFEASFEKGLEVMARRNLVKSLGRAVANEEKALLKAEMDTLRQSAGVKVAKGVAGFSYEAVKFQQWGFYVELGRRELAGDPKAVENALKNAFSGKGFLHNAQFLLGLKLASAVAMPLLEPAFEATRSWAVGKTVERSLKVIDADIQDLQGQMDDVFVSGQGDLSQIASRLDDRLRMREELIDQIPEEFQNDHFKMVKDFHQEVRADLAKLRGLAEGMNEALGPGNAFGVKAEAVDGVLESSLTYEPAKKDAFRASLNKLVGGRNVKVLGSVIAATFKFPGGVEQTLVFTPAEVKRAPVRQLPVAKRVYDSNQMAAE